MMKIPKLFPNSDLILSVFPKNYFVLFFLLVIGFSAHSQDKPLKQMGRDTTKHTAASATRGGRGSQIVDDSTKSIYGPKTTLWTTEQDVFINKSNYRPLDTTLTNYHRWTYVQKFNNLYQDLGNMGTALNPIFPILSNTIGANPGYSVYSLYYDTQEPKYFDTKSPFTKIRLVWGGDGRAMSHIEFSRNINPRWNFGFNYRPILVDKQLQRTKGVRQTVSHYYDFHTSYKSKDNRYLIFGSYRRIRHRIFENGGIYLNRDTTYDAYFDQNAQPYLVAAQSEELKNSFHIFQQYQLASPFQLYHKLDITRQRNFFSDKNKEKSDEPNYTKYFLFTNPDTDIDTINVKDGIEFKTTVNEFGFKGNAAFLFYGFYYKIRMFSTYNRYVDETTLSFKNDGIENYVGGQIAFRFDSLSELSGKAEYLLDGNYLLQANLKTPWLDATGMSSLAKSSFLPLAYRGSHNSWVNNFADPFYNQLSAFLKGDFGGFFISPGATYTTLTNYIYYRSNDVVGEQSVVPVQSSGNQQVFTPELRMSLRFFKHLYLRPQILYTKLLKNDDSAMRIPEWFMNAQLSFENTLFKNAIQVQIGVDAHWRSDYTAPSYDPTIQQYYIQDNTTTAAYPLVDVFFNGKFKGGKFFVKYHNLNQLITKTGYTPTPTYRAVGNILDFGFELILFD
jgi:hypothetical protein